MARMVRAPWGYSEPAKGQSAVRRFATPCSGPRENYLQPANAPVFRPLQGLPFNLWGDLWGLR